MEDMNPDSSEEITLFTDEEHVELDQLDFEFEQINKLRGIYRKLTVFNGHQCYQSIKNKHQRKYKYRVDLAYLNPVPYRQHKVDWKWLYFACAALLTFLVIIYSSWIAESITPSIYLALGLVFTMVTSLICSLLFVHKSYDRVIFRSQYGNVRLIQLVNNYPAKDDFRRFLGSFIGKIKSAKKIRNVDTANLLTRELQELRRLKDEKVITVREYEKAKKIIFKHKSFSPVKA